MLVGAFLALGAIGTAAAARQDPSLGIEPRSLIPVLVAGAALLVLGCVLQRAARSGGAPLVAGQPLPWSIGPAAAAAGRHRRHRCRLFLPQRLHWC